MTGDYDRAEDLIQETFLRVFYNAERFDDDDKFIAWVRVIMHNTFINSTKHEEYCYTTNEFPPQFNEMSDCTSSCVTTVYINDIYNAIDELPGNAGTVMRLLIDGHKYVEIAVMMNIPLGTVKKRINTSRAILRKKLKDYLN